MGKYPIQFCFPSSTAWISVLNNSKEEALQNAFGNAPTGVSGELEESSSVRELRNGILDKIRQLPGNKFCCDCGAQGGQGSFRPREL